MPVNPATVEVDIDVGGDMSDWELRERQEREELREAGAGARGGADVRGAGEELPLSLPTPAFMASTGED